MTGRQHRPPIPVPDDSSDDLRPLARRSSGPTSSRIEEEGKPLTGADKGRGRQKAGAVVIHHLVTAALILFVLVMAGYGWLAFRELSATDFDHRVEVTSFESARIQAHRHRIEFALSVYFLLNERYPASLDLLVDDGLLLLDDLEYAGGPVELEYERMSNAYELRIRWLPGDQAAPSRDLLPANVEDEMPLEDAPVEVK